MINFNQKVLSEYHNNLVRSSGALQDDTVAAERYDAASDVVVELLAELGLTPDSLDYFDTSIDQDVQTLLTLVAFRCPELQEFFQKVVDGDRDSEADWCSDPDTCSDDSHI